MAAVYILAVQYNTAGVTSLDPMTHLGKFDTEDAAYDRLNELYSDELEWLDTDAYTYVVTELNWMDRERYHFASERYKAPPWATEPFWRDGRYVHREQFPHISLDDPSMIAYTEDAQKGEADRQTRIKPGKYLQKYFGAGKNGLVDKGYFKGRGPLLTPQQIAYYAEWFEQGQKPRRYKHLELRFAVTPEEIVDAYSRGPRSCMSGDHFPDKSEHPAQVYGAGDLQLAYLVDTTTGKVRARGLAYPANNGFGRIYPAPENWSHDGFASSDDATDCQNELRHRLAEMGWEDVYSNGRVLEGARLLKIPVMREHGKHYYRMPYLDVSYKIVDHEDGQHFKLTLDGKWTGSTGGYANCVPMFTCYHCDGLYPVENGSGRDIRTTVYHSYDRKTGAGDPETYCTACARDATYMCSGTNNRYRTNKVRRLRDGEDRSYVSIWANDNGVYKCAYSECHYLPAHQPPVVLNGRTYATCNLHRVAFWCSYDQTLYHFDDLSAIYAGMPAKYDAEDISAADRERCNFMRRTQEFDGVNHTWKTIRDPANPITETGVAIDMFYYRNRQWQANQVRAAAMVAEAVMIAEPVRQVA